ncbi:hypothetical protein DI383_07765 [Flavobacteriaceae bacterium LYZ1037]|nr:hypothetical protein DI383_07765 [Flavobacteriaceae bacterium LYZ1037]
MCFGKKPSYLKTSNWKIFDFQILKRGKKPSYLKTSNWKIFDFQILKRGKKPSYLKTSNWKIFDFQILKLEKKCKNRFFLNLVIQISILYVYIIIE